MDAARWRRIETIFAAAVDLPAAERDAFVEMRCEGDAALVEEVRALLAADERPASIVDRALLADAVAPDPVLGGVLDGRYRTVSLLGRGGMGAVYEAVHTGTGRRVAIKVISPEVVASRAVLRRFQLEARAAGRLESPHVAQVLDVGLDAETRAPYLAIEFLRGADVSLLVSERGPLEPSLALRIVAQACRGLEAAHAEGIIHRDVKPANLFLARGPDETRIVKILDFGIAKLQDEELSGGSAITKSGTIIGSPLYMSPEQAGGERELDPRTDLWSLGVVLFELLSGSTPLDRNAPLTSLLVSIMTAPVPALLDRAPWVSPGVAAIVDRTLQKDRARRVGSARELLDLIRAELQGNLDIHEDDLARPWRPSTESVVGESKTTSAAAVAATVPLRAVRAVEAEQTGVSGAATVSDGHEERSRTARGRWVAATVLAVSVAVLAMALVRMTGGEARPTAATVLDVESASAGAPRTAEPLPTSVASAAPSERAVSSAMPSASSASSAPSAPPVPAPKRPPLPRTTATSTSTRPPDDPLAKP